MIITLPKSVDWRQKGCVTDVKNGGQCNSSWAFVTTGAVESLYAIETGELESLSEQELIDCSQSYGNQGCNGGLPEYGFQYIRDQGITKEAIYPYVAQDQLCPSQRISNEKIYIKGYMIEEKITNSKLAELVSKQPVILEIDATHLEFRNYSGGIYPAHTYQNFDHFLLVVGYGTENDVDYWICKNNWGASWGDKGYIRIERNSNLVINAYYPIGVYKGLQKIN